MPTPRFLIAWTLSPAEAAALRDADRVLSFLPPAEEAALMREGRVRMDSARAIAEELRTRAFDVFVSIAARAGIATDRRGRTLRAALQRPGEGSDWWFHRFSSRTAGPEERTMFEWVLSALTIDRWAELHGARTLHLQGAPHLLVRALRSKYGVIAPDSPSPSAPERVRFVRDLLRERVSAFKWTWRSARHAPPLARVPEGESRPLVALTGHSWLTWDPEARAFADEHFAGVDAALRARGFRVMRLLWFFPGTGGRHAAPDAIAAPFASGQAAALQAFIGRRDVLREILSVRALAIYLRWRRRESFRAVFRIGALDLFPIFADPLLAGFLGCDIALARLGALATARACDACRPFATLCHWEWFFDGRPHYEGVRRARRRVLRTTMQHAANTAVLFYHVDPAIEHRGEPDDCRPAMPEQVFVMGHAGMDLFRAAGYAPEALTLTGSTRFDLTSLRASVQALRRRRAPHTGQLLRLLVLPSSISRDADLIEAAYAAADGIDGLRVEVRKKPGSHARPRGSTTRLGAQLQFSTAAALDEDLAAADLVLFSASSAADQAFACGIPTWQWLPVNLQGTSLARVAALPGFHTVAALREALATFVREPWRFAPAPAAVDTMIQQIAGPSDGLEAERIADRMRALYDERQGRVPAPEPEPARDGVCA